MFMPAHEINIRPVFGFEQAIEMRRHPAVRRIIRVGCFETLYHILSPRKRLRMFSFEMNGMVRNNNNFLIFLGCIIQLIVKVIIEFRQDGGLLIIPLALF